jgi:hypothetical protein
LTDDNSIEDSGGISKNIKDYSIDTDTSFEKKQKSADGQGNMPLYVFKKNDEWVVKNERFSGIE